MLPLLELAVVKSLLLLLLAVVMVSLLLLFVDCVVMVSLLLLLPVLSGGEEVVMLLPIGEFVVILLLLLFELAVVMVSLLLLLLFELAVVMAPLLLLLLEAVVAGSVVVVIGTHVVLMKVSFPDVTVIFCITHDGASIVVVITACVVLTFVSLLLALTNCKDVTKNTEINKSLFKYTFGVIDICLLSHKYNFMKTF